MVIRGYLKVIELSAESSIPASHSATHESRLRFKVGAGPLHLEVVVAVEGGEAKEQKRRGDSSDDHEAMTRKMQSGKPFFRSFIAHVVIAQPHPFCPRLRGTTVTRQKAMSSATLYLVPPKYCVECG